LVWSNVSSNSDFLALTFFKNTVRYQSISSRVSGFGVVMDTANNSDFLALTFSESTGYVFFMYANNMYCTVQLMESTPLDSRFRGINSHRKLH
jgi:hypothetical protein